MTMSQAEIAEVPAVSADDSFAELVRRVRLGDAAAAEELVRRYQPALKRMVHVRLVDARLRRLFDSEDICQSVLGSFFVRAALGQYDIEQPTDLIRLLAIMARNKVVAKARRMDEGGAGGQRVAITDLPTSALADGEASPSRVVGLRELLQTVRNRLPQDERRLLELREQGLEWAEVATQIGANAEALRKRLRRAVDVAVEGLGLDD